LFEGVFHLEEMSTRFQRVLGLRHQAIGLACSFWMLRLGNLGCKDWLLAILLYCFMRAFTNPLTTEYGCSHFAVN
jgi:hypothetical protein